MKIYSVYDKEFKEYGQVVDGYDLDELMEAMKKIELPKSGTAYQASIDSLEECKVFDKFTDNLYGGMPIEVGMCYGYNTKLTCVEYHRDSEINIGSNDFVLLLAKRSEITDGKIDGSVVKAFKVPKGVAVEVYATTLHYAPCHTDEKEGFRVAVILPKGTNEKMPEISILNEEDKLLFACNKWLIAHKDSDEAKNGAVVGLTGDMVDIG